MAENMVTYITKENPTISLDPAKLITQAITVVPLASAKIAAGTTMAESSVSIGGDTITIHRPAVNGDTRSGILLTEIAAKADVSTPPIQADLVGAVLGKYGVFKTANITDETVKGTLQSETLLNPNLFFK